MHIKTALTQLFDMLCEDIFETTARHLCDAVLKIEQVLRCEFQRVTASIATKGWLKWSAMGLYPKGI
ncbi:MAG TPA: hypothetical protein VK066_16495 [Chloroflexota bacterium]|nr:hypothetical protein [Chloroflexota bacterium]